MRSIHLATSLGGGAGIAAGRIHSALLQVGVESLMYSNDSRVSDLDEIKVISNSPFTKLQSKINTYFQSRYIQNSNDLVTPFSINKVNIKKIEMLKPDIVHIHATYNLIDLPVISEISNQGIPVLVTLHDQRHFTGGCHYSRDCNGYLKSCESCPQVRTPFKPVVTHLFKKNLELMSGINRIHFASPSDWLSNIAAKSAMLEGRQIRTIRNPIPKIFETEPAQKLKSTNKVVIGFASLDLHNPYKGWNTLLEAFRFIQESQSINLEKFKVKLIGSGNSLDLSQIVEIQQVVAKNEFEMSKALMEVDYLVVPSDSDNLPSVVGEALMAGVRVIASEVGGTPEILRIIEGDLFPAGDAKKLAEILCSKLDLSEKPLDKKKISQIFSEESVALQYKNYYEEIVTE